MFKEEILYFFDFGDDENFDMMLELVVNSRYVFDCFESCFFDKMMEILLSRYRLRYFLNWIFFI